MQTMHKTVVAFLQDQHATIRISGISELLQRIQDGFIALLHNPPSGVLCFPSPPPEDPKDPNIGLITRRGEASPDGTRYDKKIFFHYPHGEQLETLLAKHNSSFLHIYRDLLIDCKTLHVICRSFIKQFCHHFDNLTDGKLHLYERMGTELDMLRILAYTNFREDEPTLIGTEHRDRCGLTLSLYESAPGLEFGESEQGPWKPVSSRKDDYLIFASALLEQLSREHGSNPDIKAVWHRVRGMPGTSRVSSGIIRLAIVFFSKLPLPLELACHAR